MMVARHEVPGNLSKEGPSRRVRCDAFLGFVPRLSLNNFAETMKSAKGIKPLSDAKLNATGRDFCQIWCD